LARFLALDWDHNQLHVVAATISRGTVRIQQAQVWPEQQVPNPAEPEALGKLLKQRLKEAGISPAPVLASIGRDRVILKDIRYPAVPDVEEPAVVRFQAVKELTDPPDEVVIDYARVGDSNCGERRALALIARKEMVDAYQEICKSAGLKLAGLTPRPFGIATCLRRLAGTTVLTPAPEPKDGSVAVLALGERWAEFCVFRGESLFFARSLTLGPGLAAEVRRNLAVLSGQTSQHSISALYVAGGSEHAAIREQLKDMLEAPVYAFDPFSGVERPEVALAGRGGFTGAVGLLHAWAEKPELPINFIKPRQPKAARDPNQRRLYVYGGLAAAAVLAVVTFCYLQIAAVDREVDTQLQINAQLDSRLAMLDDDDRKFKALSEWDKGGINWLDELYEYTERFPDPKNVQLVQLSANPLTRSARDKYAARLSVTGIIRDDYKQIDRLLDALAEDGFRRSDPKTLGPNRSVDRFSFPQQFTTSIDVQKVPPNKYIRRLPDPPERGRLGGDDNGGLD
jgi:Tfp pilus assembly PilM family ATPase